MGWLFFPKPHDIKGYFRDQYTFERNGRAHRVLADAIVGTRVYYAAVETIADGKREVGAVVNLLSFKPKDPDGMTFGYKDMDETMGPYYHDCPARILDLLTPTESAYANEWRAKCRERLERKANRIPITPGVRAIFEQPIRFTDGTEHAEFIAERYRKRGVVWRPWPHGGQRYRITKRALDRARLVPRGFIICGRIDPAP